MTRQRLRSFFIPVLLLTCLFSTSTHADNIETLVMPGKVIEGHAKYEEECKNCHRLFAKEDQTQLCLDCHKDINKDVKTKRGYHGRLKIDPQHGCKSCHTEHRGRKADIIKLDPQTFNHALTEFELKNRHKNVDCQRCHDPKKKHRETPNTCHSCHNKVSPHGQAMGQFAKKCDTCHTDEAWNTIRYDHNKTKYPLTGKHKDTTCIACHVQDQYTKTPTGCYDCHRLNDVHSGKNGKNCKECHNTSNWKKLSFDHDRDTKFPLTGRHKTTGCIDCHTTKNYKDKLETTCISCHKRDDIHKGKNGTKCEGCHDTRTWKSMKFDHDKTKFPLRGKHKNARCDTCHKGDPAKEKLGTACYNCHKLEDVHHGQQGKQCQNCHNENGWREKVKFDHDLTRFPLIGLHAVTPCEECHLTSSYKDTKHGCNDCHSKKDTHKGTLGENCELCHTPNSWKVWRFDHDKQSEFKIDGKHTKLHCSDCHKEKLSKIPHASRNCIACHRSDDVHNGQFGPRCSQCHTTESFRDIKMNR